MSAILRRQGIDSFFVSKPENVRYMSGYGGDDAYLLFAKSKKYFITDSRYYLQAKKDVKSFKIIIAKVPVSRLLAEILAKSKAGKTAFEAGQLPYAAYKRIAGKLAEKGIRFLPLEGAVEGLRQVKDAPEIALIRDSIAILENAVLYFESILKPGLSENDLASKTEYFIRAASGEWASFEIIVASGKNSAFPHARPGDRIIKPNDMVLLDLGVSYEGYKSDLTRVFFLGKINTKQKKIYGIVKEAQRRSVKAIKPGAKISEIDGIARGFINAKGFGSGFGHALGHGIGLEVHESPSVSSRNHAKIKPGMVFTIEPAIYLPDWGGIRIEDMVLVTKKGCEVLTDDIDK
ncbi:MAG: Xaa-Pro peptidase family protein [Candidatus Omnitrophica bacterium]|nr:Xaa-Pro peptidase family protein [Candidatus Omnitrophota bacterium]MDD5310688.1 Xaa-Pro peptidase family protein [Candidatus Omnitrophota bacterium]MDD5545692.1 Xaa-Pro peptidase family protein [Candidatus Omnitrophota bacterium]